MLWMVLIKLESKEHKMMSRMINREKYIYIRIWERTIDRIEREIQSRKRIKQQMRDFERLYQRDRH